MRARTGVRIASHGKVPWIRRILTFMIKPRTQRSGTECRNDGLINAHIQHLVQNYSLLTISCMHNVGKVSGIVAGSPFGARPSLALLGTALRASKNRARFLSNQSVRTATHSDNKTAPMGGCFAGGEGGIRTHVPGEPDHLISSQRRYDHFGASPEGVVFYQSHPGRRTCRFCYANPYAET